MATLRVILDTNVLVSGIAYQASVPGKIMAAWRHGSIDVLLSAYILEELRRVLPRLVQRHNLTSIEDNGIVNANIYKLKLLPHRSSGQPTGEFET